MSDDINMYRIKFKCRGWLTNSTRYFNVTSVQEAIKDIDYAMQHDMITSNCIYIKSVSMYNRFSGKWDRQDLSFLSSMYKQDYRGRYIIRHD